MNSGYYDLRGKIVKAERRISVLTERLEMWAQYQKYKPVRQKLDKVAPVSFSSLLSVAISRLMFPLSVTMPRRSIWLAAGPM